MRKTRLWLAALLLTCALLLALPGLADELQFGVVYNTDTLNLRQQATQYSTWLGKYCEGDWLSISGSSGNWYYVTGPDGKTGYVSKTYVQVTEPEYRTIGLVANQKATAYLNLRAAPSYGATVVDYYYNGVPCVLLSQSNGWYHVRVDGVDGYFREEYMTTAIWATSEEVATIVSPNSGGVNLRTGPGMGYDVLGQYEGGQYVLVLQQGNGWWKVSIDGKVGYMKTDFLKEGVHKPFEKESATVAKGVGTAIVSNPKSTQVLNLRLLADVNSRVLGQYRNGVRLTVLAYGTEWCQVQDQSGTIGYMMTKYLTVKDLAGTATMMVKHPQKTFVNLRSAPSMMTGTVLAKIPHGTAVTVLAPSSNGWVKVSYKGYTGYVVDYFLE